MVELTEGEPRSKPMSAGHIIELFNLDSVILLLLNGCCDNKLKLLMAAHKNEACHINKHACVYVCV